MNSNTMPIAFSRLLFFLFLFLMGGIYAGVAQPEGNLAPPDELPTAGTEEIVEAEDIEDDFIEGASQIIGPNVTHIEAGDASNFIFKYSPPANIDSHFMYAIKKDGDGTVFLVASDEISGDNDQVFEKNSFGYINAFETVYCDDRGPNPCFELSNNIEKNLYLLQCRTEDHRLAVDEGAHKSVLCSIAQKLNTTWFTGYQIGADAYYARTPYGEPMCYSTDGENCIKLGMANDLNRLSLYKDISMFKSSQLKELLTQYDSVYLTLFQPSIPFIRSKGTNSIRLPEDVEQGKRVSIKVGSWSGEFAVDVISGDDRYTLEKGDSFLGIYIGSRWFDSTQGLNSNVDFLLAARPLICTSERQMANHYWCNQLPTNSAAGLQYHNTMELIEQKMNHMDSLFAQAKDWVALKVDADNGYPAEIHALSDKIKAKKRENNNPSKQFTCGFIKGITFGLAKSHTPCAQTEKQIADLMESRKALIERRASQIKEAMAKIEEARVMHWREIYKRWGANDATHFAALIKEGSQSLDELKKLEEHFHKSAEEKQQEYISAMQKYIDDGNSLKTFEGFVEDMPGIGGQIKRIIDYAENPTNRNLRRMFLGELGPTGEVIEAGLEIKEGDADLDSDTMKFIGDVLQDIGNDHSLGSALEDIASDFINDFGDELVESVRSAGFWKDNPDSDSPSMSQIDYTGIVDLRAQSEQYSYDPWLDDAEYGQLFQDKFTAANDHFTDRMADPLAYDPSSLTDIEYASGGAKFNQRMSVIFSHSFGRDYADIVKKTDAYRLWTAAQVNHELYKVIADPAYHEQRTPYWVDSSVLGARPAGLLYDSNHAMIVFNKDLLDSEADIAKFYLEELGHMLNWWRCKIFGLNPPVDCAVHGDAGARFRDVVLLDINATETQDRPFSTLIAQLPVHNEVDRAIVRFTNNNTTGILEGWPHYYRMNDHMPKGAKVDFLFRIGVDIKSEYPGVSDELDLELSLGTPVPTPKDNPWGKPHGKYCEEDTQTECDMPTMWMAVSFRDLIKFSVADLAKAKLDAKKIGFDASPRIVRKHGGKLPFQLSSVNGIHWKYMSSENIYFKKINFALELSGNPIESLRAGGAFKSIPSSSKPMVGFKSTPVQTGYVVEIPVADKKLFEQWLSLDIASAVLGCAGGVVVSVFTEDSVDPIVACHLGSDLSEILETASEGFDKRPTTIFLANGNIAIPAVEYKHEFTNGSEPDTPNTLSINSNSSTKLTDKFKKNILNRAGARTLGPVLVARFRVNFDYTVKVVQKGEHELPSASISD